MRNQPSDSPWTVRPSTLLPAYVALADANGEIIGELQGRNPVDLALILKAPELLAVCKELLAEVEHAINQAGYQPNDRESVQRAIDLLAKIAKGQP